MRLLSALFGFGFLICLAGCSDQSAQKVVLYSSIDASYTREVIDAFEDLYPEIEVALVSDSEAAKSTGLVNRLIAERDRPVADVFWSGDPIRATHLVQMGIADLHAETSFQSAARIRLIIVNKNKENSRRPESVLDLASPEFAPHSCIANPLFGTASMHAAAIFETYGDARAAQFFNDFVRHGGRMLGSNGEVKRRVSSGEFTFGLTDSDDVSVALVDGKPVDYVIPDQGVQGGGAILIPTVPVQIKNAPHPELGETLANFLRSATVERILAESDAAHFPGNPELAVPKVFDQVVLADLKIATIDYDKVAERLDKLQDGFLREWVASALK